MFLLRCWWRVNVIGYTQVAHVSRKFGNELMRCASTGGRMMLLSLHCRLRLYLFSRRKATSSRRIRVLTLAVLW